MSAATKRPLAEAQAAAAEFINALPLHHFERIEIAGSIRRMRPEVGDVEIVVIPIGDLLHRWLDDQTATSGLFGSASDMKRATYQNGTHRWGERYKGVEWRGLKYELFFATPDNWGPILAIRTGPADFSRLLVTRLRDHTELEMDGGYLREMRVKDYEGAIVPCRTEREFLARCMTPWLEPEERDAYTESHPCRR